MNPIAAYPLAITAAVLVPVIMWLTTWPLHPPTEAQAADLAVLIIAIVGDLHAWLGGHLQAGAMQQQQRPDHPEDQTWPNGAPRLSRDAQAQRQA